jgi:hypothetical protein
MRPPLIGELVVDFSTGERLNWGAAGEEKRQILRSRLVFLTFQKVIYIGVEGYT